MISCKLERLASFASSDFSVSEGVHDEAGAARTNGRRDLLHQREQDEGGEANGVEHRHADHCRLEREDDARNVNYRTQHDDYAKHNAKKIFTPRLRRERYPTAFSRRSSLVHRA